MVAAPGVGGGTGITECPAEVFDDVDKGEPVMRCDAGQPGWTGRGRRVGRGSDTLIPPPIE